MSWVQSLLGAGLFSCCIFSEMSAWTGPSRRSLADKNGDHCLFNSHTVKASSQLFLFQLYLRWAILAHHVALFSSVLLLNTKLVDEIYLMLGFKLMISSIGGGRFTNWATTSDHFCSILVFCLVCFHKQYWISVIVKQSFHLFKRPTD